MIRLLGFTVFCMGALKACILMYNYFTALELVIAGIITMFAGYLIDKLTDII